MRHRAHQLAVLEDGAAAHALDDAAGQGAELLIRHGQHHVLALAVPVDAGDPHRKLPHLTAVHGGQDGGGPGTKFAYLRDLPVKRALGDAVNAAVAVDLHAAQDRAAGKISVQRPRHACGPRRDAVDLRLRDAARLQRHRLARDLIGDAVAQGAVGAAVRVAEGHGADAGDRVPQPHAQHPLPLVRQHRLHKKFPQPLSPAHRQLHRIAPGAAHGADQLRRAVDLLPVHPQDTVSLLQARLRRRAAAALFRFHLGYSRHQHALRPDPDAHRLSAHDQLLRKGCRGKKRRQEQAAQRR